MWPIQLAFLRFIVCRMFLSSLTLCNTSEMILYDIIVSQGNHIQEIDANLQTPRSLASHVCLQLRFSKVSAMFFLQASGRSLSWKSFGGLWCCQCGITFPCLLFPIRTYLHVVQPGQRLVQHVCNSWHIPLMPDWKGSEHRVRNKHINNREKCKLKSRRRRSIILRWDFKQKDGRGRWLDSCGSLWHHQSRGTFGVAAGLTAS
jgi:hypothetical protein